MNSLPSPQPARYNRAMRWTLGVGVGVMVARGELEIAVQQMSELLPVAGLAHITPFPPEVQIVSVFSAGVVASCPDMAMAREVIRFLAGPGAASAVVKSGLTPAA